MAARPRVLVTRAPHQGSELAERLRALGADPVLIPTIETVPPHSFAVLDAALADLYSFDWLVFTSANAVEVFASRFARPPATTQGTRVAAIGAATQRALEHAGFSVDLVPEQAVAESLTAALLASARKDDGSPTRFLLIRAEDGRDLLPDTLRAAGAEVNLAPAYRTVIPEGSIDQLRELFRDPTLAPDAITFTSSSTARNLVLLCQQAGILLPEAVLRVSIGPITSRTMSELGIPPHAEAPEASVASLAQTVADRLKLAP